MDWQSLLNWLAPVVGVAMTMYTRHVQKQLDDQKLDHAELSDEFNRFQITAAKEYVTHIRLNDLMGDIKSTLHRIENKLDQKEDKGAR